MMFDQRGAEHLFTPHGTGETGVVVETWLRVPGVVHRVSALTWLLLLLPAAWWSVREYDVARTAVVLLLAAAFVTVWIRAVFRSLRMTSAKRDVVDLVVLGLLAALLMVIGGWAWFGTLFFVVARAVQLLPRPTSHVVAPRHYLVALVMVGVFASIVLSGGEVWLELLMVAVVGVGVVGLVLDLAANNRALVASREQVSELAAETERLRIARNLHDALGHTLTLLAVKADLARRMIDTDIDGARREMDAVAENAQTALADVRAMVTGYRRPHLAVEIAAARAALATVHDVRIDAADVDLPADVDEALAWAVREGVTNVLRHSTARWCTLRFVADAQTAVVEVVNDGARCSSDTGNGLVGLHERIRAVGGTMERGPTGEHGEFAIRVTVPLEEVRR